jgi:hypothetical protein
MSPVMSETLKALAERYGIALHYKDARGKTVPANLQTVYKLLQNMGVLLANGEECNTLADEAGLPPVLVVRSPSGTVAIELSTAVERRRIRWILRLESGETRHGAADTIPSSTRDGHSKSSLVLSNNQSVSMPWFSRAALGWPPIMPAPMVTSDEIYLLSYRAGFSEPGPEKSFNFSKEAASERWDAYFLDMRFALDGVQADSNGIKVVRRPG